MLVTILLIVLILAVLGGFTLHPLIWILAVAALVWLLFNTMGGRRSTLP